MVSRPIIQQILLLVSLWMMSSRFILVAAFTSNHYFAATAKQSVYATKIYASKDELQSQQHGVTSDEISKEVNDRHSTRRTMLLQSASAVAAASWLQIPQVAQAATSSDSVYKPAVRPTAYRVDSTVPPTLLPIASAREQLTVLKQLAQGSGTDKDAIVVDTLNLNNMLNKAVFGSAEFIQSQFKPDESKKGQGYASFVCLGLPTQVTPSDMELASSLLSSMIQNKPTASKMAVGVPWAPLSTQSALNEYANYQDYAALAAAMEQAGVDASTLQLYQPVLAQLAGKVDLLALSPEYQDIQTALTQGLQQVNPERRSTYVVDPSGFIAMTQQPQFQLWTDRSLFKDLPPKVKEGDFFAASILKHECAASACSQYAAQKSGSTAPLVAVLAPIQDVRYLVGGINGRIPRVSQSLGLTKVTANAVTTILLNPTATSTLSKSRYLRLEIGTGPETVQYQSKVADYLWFSQSPKVNLIPRLMN